LGTDSQRASHIVAAIVVKLLGHFDPRSGIG
jgi:hypothetical protein